MNESIAATQKERLEEMIGLLAYIRLRPGMWFGSKDEDALRAFTTGFSLAASLLGADIDKGQGIVWAERGWKLQGSMDHIHLLKESGMSNEEMALETFTVLILHILRQFQLTGEKVLGTHNQMRQRYLENGHEISPDLRFQMESLEKVLGILKDS